MAKTTIDKDTMEVFSDFLIHKMVEKFVTKKDIQHLPTKEEFYSSQDNVMKELKDLRDEVTVSAHQTFRNSDEIKTLKKAVFAN